MEFRPSGNRMNIVKKKGITIINDSYNANPSSMKAALSTLAEIPAKRRIAVLGDMLELGPGSKKYHQEIIKFAKKLGVDIILPVGDHFPSALKNKAEAIKKLKSLLKDGDAILIKGSRGMRMEEIVEAI
jgi:UDP-N-acetylmuramoyl-tripeptide--D-alanyl-D-alanine ligase